MQKLIVDLQPVGRRASIPAGESLLSAAQAAGINLISICGGNGLCLECRVRLINGKLSPLSLVEEANLDESDLENGIRLACQAIPLSDVKVDIPPESLSAAQRLQVEGQEEVVELEPQVLPRDLTFPPPSLADLRDDLTRLRDTFGPSLDHHLSIDTQVMVQFSEQMRAWNWKGRLAIDQDGRVVSVLPDREELYGFAVDIGTTKLAAYLVSLENGRIAGKQGAMNPQIAYGEDVVARIAYANQGVEHRRTLQTRLVDTLNGLLSDLRQAAGVSQAQVVDAAIVGNTAMHHLFAGLSVRQLGQAPYVAALTEAINLPASQVGLDLAPGARIYLPPNIAGYVGADHVSMLIATHAWEMPGVTLALDIGTNTEICLSTGSRLLSCSTASGPAFEGAHIQAGMRAAPGAIERVQTIEGSLQFSTIENQLPVGVCGSGILDAVAELLANGVIDSRGVFRYISERVIPTDRGGAFLLVPGEQTGHHTDILVTRKDINEIQLAKAAIRAGVEILLIEAGLKAQDIEHFIVAGAFGTYLYLPNAVRIGMFPDLPHERYHQVGNAAGIGACQMLVSRRKRAMASEILKRMEYVELTTHPKFSDTFVDMMALKRN